MLKTLFNIRKNTKSIPRIKRRNLFAQIKFDFSYKDDQFWEEYTKRKGEGGKLPALESQEILINKAVHSWKYSDRHSLSCEELLACIRELDPKLDSPFIILDVREESEYDLYKLPLRTRVNHFYLEPLSYTDSIQRNE